MSTKIYSGYVLPTMNSFELQEFCNRLRRDMGNLAEGLYTKQLARIATEIIDRRDLGLDLSYYLTDHKNLSPFLASIIKITEEQKEMRKSRTRNLEYDYDCEIALMPLEDKILCVFYAEKEQFIKLWKSQAEVKPFPYWDNTDKPRNITQEQWDKRGDEWVKALGVTGIPADAGLIARLVPEYPPMPKIEEILENVPPFKQRVKKLAKIKIASRFFNDLLKTKQSDKAQFSEFVIAYRGADEYLETEKGREELTTEESRIKSKLKKHITKEDLLQDLKII